MPARDAWPLFAECFKTVLVESIGRPSKQWVFADHWFEEHNAGIHDPASAKKHDGNRRD